MDSKDVKRMKRKLGYEKHIITQLHEEIFQTTSEHKYYELGVAQGIYIIYHMFENLIKNGYEEVKLTDIMEVVKKSANDNENIGINFNKMVEYDKEDN